MFDVGRVKKKNALWGARSYNRFKAVSFSYIFACIYQQQLIAKVWPAAAALARKQQAQYLSSDK
jgi:hypothetical protein